MGQYQCHKEVGTIGGSRRILQKSVFIPVSNFSLMLKFHGNEWLDSWLSNTKHVSKGGGEAVLFQRAPSAWNKLR